MGAPHRRSVATSPVNRAYNKKQAVNKRSPFPRHGPRGQCPGQWPQTKFAEPRADSVVRVSLGKAWPKAANVVCRTVNITGDGRDRKSSTRVKDLEQSSSITDSSDKRGQSPGQRPQTKFAESRFPANSVVGVSVGKALAKGRTRSLPNLEQHRRRSGSIE